mgnify:CR=1 FL=1
MNTDTKSSLLMNKLFSHYKDNYKYTEILKAVIEQKSIISLRMLDWFVTNYAKRNNVYYTLGDTLFNVHFNYKNQLKAFSKKWFDPFCRRQRIYLYIKDDILIKWSDTIDDNTEMTVIVTTIGQMNFFKWAIYNNVLNYVIKNNSDIETDMIQRSNNRKKNGKRTIISTPTNGYVTKNAINGVIKW